MKIDLISRGAPELPEGFHYRVHVYEVYETVVDVNVAIIEKIHIKLLRFIPIRRKRVVVSSTVRIPRDPDYDIASKRPIVEEASMLYRYAKRQDKLTNN